MEYGEEGKFAADEETYRERADGTDAGIGSMGRRRLCA